MTTYQPLNYYTMRRNKKRTPLSVQLLQLLLAASIYGLLILIQL